MQLLPFDETKLEHSESPHAISEWQRFGLEWDDGVTETEWDAICAANRGRMNKWTNAERRVSDEEAQIFFAAHLSK